MLGDLEEPDIDEDTAFVFIPIRPVLNPAERIQPELRRLADGTLTLPAYTSVPALVRGCGEHQTWAGFPVDQLPRVQSDCGFDTVSLNMALPLERRTRPEENRWPGQPEDWDG